MLEIIATTTEEARLAERAGADRIELVSALPLGGLTPSYGLIRSVLASVEIPVHVLIRPHDRSFTYSDTDKETIISDIDLVRELGAAGVVVGALTDAGRIDEGFIGEVIKHKGDLSFTFHRAFDASADLMEAAEVLADFPEIDRILTSGGARTALEGAEMIKRLIEAHPELTVLPGAGITLENAGELLRLTAAHELHVGTGARTNGTLDEAAIASFKKLVGGN
ncbi:copper homeostasis protein CutC [Exiguobacterium flavidum]|uniref:copper homeostasis protein CutC n=1 Tax=Exiguobacterium flavidum TaxID=2184695 RepID=UPI000DF85112|nr:copper homeostasis protein CutC [Exiguobacterium flavidum]